MATPNLNLTHITQGQSNKETTANNALDGLDNAMNTVTTIAITGDRDITAAEFRGCGILRFTGSPGSEWVARIPAGITKKFGVQNFTGVDCIVEPEDAGTDFIVVPNGSLYLLQSDGSDIYGISQGAGGGTSQINFTKSTAFRGFRYTVQSTQVLAAATLEDVEWDEEVFDTEDAFASNVYTIPQNLNGRFMSFTATLRLATSDNCIIGIQKDGSYIADGGANSSTDVTCTSGAVQVFAGEVIKVVYFGGSGATTVDDDRCYFAGHIIDPTIVYASSPFTGFSVERSGNQSLTIGSDQLDFDVENIDSRGAFYNTEWVCPAAFAGRWMQFNAGLKLSAANAGSELTIERDAGGGYVAISGQSFDGDVASVASKPVLLAEGDSFRVTSVLGAAGTAIPGDGQTFFTGYLVETALPSISAEDAETSSHDLDFTKFNKHASVTPCDNGSAINVTIESGNPFHGTVKYFRRGAGDVSFVAGSGVSILSTAGFLSIDTQYQSAILTHLGGDVYWLEGPLKA